jgi:hypothetical protein
LRDTERGAKARAVLESELVKEAFQKIEEGILSKWKEAPVRDVEGQTTLKLLHKVFSDFKGYFEEAVTTGQFAANALEHERTIAQRARDAVREFRR